MIYIIFCLCEPSFGKVYPFHRKHPFKKEIVDLYTYKRCYEYSPPTYLNNYKIEKMSTCKYI
ncbi:hypothetical protein [Leyella lascolaii]|uniref:Uncharacterized protein n=1 Tax=Leyella lascolaii TaxID=1776379 RepID=A0AAW7JKN1_9BACT|nr:hypothetical protein [Leyella lascolaii]MDN0023340.1 hypothetical protein [Leyella lascolaii]MDN0025982.1 hypothetical protein [Leyella lascolaii]